MYIKVTQYDKMQLADDSPQLRVISSFCFEVFIIRYIINCVCIFYMTTFSLVANACNLKIECM